VSGLRRDEARGPRALKDFGCRAIAFLILTALPGQVTAQARLAGRVLAESLSAPIPLAQVELTGPNIRSATANALGRFSLTVAPGRYEIRIKAVGFAPVVETIDISSGTTDFEISLRRLTRLESVNVTASRVDPFSRLSDFEQRRKAGIGRFIAADVLQAAAGRLLGDVITQRLPGLRLRNIGFSSQYALISARGPLSISQPNCPIAVYVNELPQRSGFDINSLELTTVLGVEYYSSAQTPSRYTMTGAQCGTALIWTK